jgi:hypothetical protein
MISAFETHFAYRQPVQLLVQACGKFVPGFWRQPR